MPDMNGLVDLYHFVISLINDPIGVKFVLLNLLPL
jgi:hypothetical protein